MATARIPEIEHVENDEDLKRYIKTMKALVIYIARELAIAAATIHAMLKAHDQRPGAKRGRAGKVARPIALAAGLMVLISKYVALVARRFDLEYREEIAEGQGKKRRRPSGSIRFGG